MKSHFLVLIYSISLFFNRNLGSRYSDRRAPLMDLIHWRLLIKVYLFHPLSVIDSFFSTQPGARIKHLHVVWVKL